MERKVILNFEMKDLLLRQNRFPVLFTKVILSSFKLKSKESPKSKPSKHAWTSYALDVDRARSSAKNL